MMKIRLISAILLAIMLYILLPSLSPSIAKDGEIWEMSEKIIEPADGSWEQGIYSLKVNESGITLSVKHSGGGYKDLDWTPQGPYTETYTFTFNPLPETLVPGQKVELNLSGTGSRSGDEPESEQTNRISVSLLSNQIEPYLTFNGEDSIHDFWVTTSDSNKPESISFTVPPVVPDGFFTVKIEWGGAGSVRWTYKLGERKTIFTGYAIAYDDQNQHFPIAGAPVRLRLEHQGTVRVTNTTTDKDGVYEIAVDDVDDKTKYQVQLILEDGGGVFEVFGYTDVHPVTYVTTESEVGSERGDVNMVVTNLLFEPGMAQGESVRIGTDGSLTKVRDPKVADDRAAALCYSHIYNAMAYGRDTLGVNYDLKLPLSVVLDDPNVQISNYNYQVGRLDIVQNDLNTALISTGLPDTLRHEFGHFFSQDSTWFGDNIMPLKKPDETNHGGVRNRTSVDSVLEGGATFLILLFKGLEASAETDGKATYVMSDGYPLNLEDNEFETDGNLPWEEFKFTALLWDILDKNRPDEPQDQVAWGSSKLWGVLANVSGWTVHDHYTALKTEAGEPLPGPHDTPTALDQLFILHSFYAETNNQPGWQQGEPIGYADSWNPRVTPSAVWGPTQDPANVRFSPAVLQHPWLELELPSDIPGSDIAEMTVFPTDERIPWTALLQANQDRRFPLAVPASADRIEIRLLVPGYKVTPFEFTLQAFESAVEQGTNVVRTKPDFSPSSIESPINFKVQREGSSTATLTWSLPQGIDHVIVVRGASHTPSNPRDGVVIYEGTALKAIDDGIVPTNTTYYAAFSIGQDGTVSHPAITSSSVLGASVKPSSEATSSTVHWYLIVGGIVIIGLIVFLLRRKRKHV
ncbi:LPXTG cell wall anchor domain-containing protein [Chloroflexota bacterium]